MLVLINIKFVRLDQLLPTDNLKFVKPIASTSHNKSVSNVIRSNRIGNISPGTNY